MRRLALEWGVYPVLAPESESTDEVISNSVEATIQNGYAKEGDLVVITAGIPAGLSGSTNLIKVHIIGKILLKGTGIGDRSVSGKVCIGGNEAELLSKFNDGDILVCVNTAKDMVSFMERSSAIVTEHGGLTSHAAIVGLNFGVPTVVGAEDATTILKDGDIITVDSLTGQIYKGETRVI
jgi:pyruvate kinase